ncbi:hypothetical protein GCM10008949_24950 [Deinococcus humi]|nr:hypothetical protein GCM10008949_24950 [Deinococcus humi]
MSAEKWSQAAGHPNPDEVETAAGKVRVGSALVGVRGRSGGRSSVDCDRSGHVGATGLALSGAADSHGGGAVVGAASGQWDDAD